MIATRPGRFRRRATAQLLILWKARREWFHWFTALVLLFYPSGGLWEFTQVSQIAYHYVALGGLLWPSFLLFLYLTRKLQEQINESS